MKTKMKRQPAPGSCPHGNHPDACTDDKCVDDAAERIYGIRPDVRTLVAGEMTGTVASVRRYQPGLVQIGIGNMKGFESKGFSDAAAREIALALLKRIAKDPFDRAVYAAGWTSSHECRNSDDRCPCIHYVCAFCGMNEGVEGIDSDMPTHVCKGPKS